MNAVIYEKSFGERTPFELYMKMNVLSIDSVCCVWTDLC